MQVHHVGIVHHNHDIALWALQRAAIYLPPPPGATEAGYAYKYVPEFDCDCYLHGNVEIVIPHSGSLQRFLTERGNALHHVAFQVNDIDSWMITAGQRGVPVLYNHAVDGVAGLRVNFVHPDYFGGTLIEVVQPQWH